ncbi:MAG: preprotein translocase subunit YajC [Phycisphaerales bacterium]
MIPMTSPDLFAAAILAQTTPQNPPAGVPGAGAAPPPAPNGADSGFKMPGAGGEGQAAAPGATGAAGGPPPPGAGSGLSMFVPLALVLLLVLIMTSMAGRKERKRRDALLSGVKRGDRVQTAGGVIGTIVDLTDSEMTLRVDETTNTRIRFSRSAVQQVMREGKDGGRAEVEVKPANQTAAHT